METPLPRKPKKEKSSSKKPLAAAVAISAGIHGAALVIADKTLRQNEKDRATLGKAGQQFPVNPTAETKVQEGEIPTENLSEEVFEALVAAKIDHAGSLDELRHELILMYQKRLKAFNKSAAEDIKKDGIYDGNYAEFLMKTSAYTSTLENLQTGKLEFIKVTELQQRWAKIMAVLKRTLNQLPEKADRLDRLNATAQSVVRDGIVEEYSQEHARFEDLLLKKKGNCDGISNLSMAVYRELFGRSGYHFRTYADHVRTQFTDEEGKEYLFENTSLPNEGTSIPEEDQGLKVPAEAIMVSYLEKHGYSRAQFPPTLQALWKEKKGHAQGGGKSNTIFGDLPNKGFCTDGSEKCFVKPGITYSLKKRWEEETEEKEKTINQMTLAEILDADFFTIDVDDWDMFFDDEHKPIEFQTGILHFHMDEEKLKRAIMNRTIGVRSFLNLTKRQVQKLDLLLTLADWWIIGDPEDGPILLRDEINESLGMALEQKSSKEDDIAWILQMKNPYRKLKAFQDFVRQYGEVPETLVDALDPLRGHLELGNLREYGEGKNFGLSIKTIGPKALKKLLQKSDRFTQTLGITEIDEAIIDAIAESVEQDAFIELPHLILKDPHLASYFGKKLKHVGALTLGGFANAESARAFVASGNDTQLEIANSNALDKDTARELARFQGHLLSFDVSGGPMPESVLMELAQHRNNNAITHYSNRPGQPVRGGTLAFRFKNKRSITREEAHVLKNTQAGTIAFQDTTAIEDPAIMEDLSESHASYVELDARNISDEVAKIWARAVFKIPSSTKGASGLLIAKYHQPPPNETQMVEQSGNGEKIGIYMNTYGRLTPAMAGPYVHFLSGWPEFRLADVDEETARAISQALREDQERGVRENYLVVAQFHILDISPSMARTLFGSLGQNMALHIDFEKVPSDAVLHEIIGSNPGKITDISIPSELAPFQAKILNMYIGPSLHITCKKISADAMAQLTQYPKQALEISVEEPLDENAAEHLALLQGKLIINQNYGEPIGITEGAAKILARKFRGTMLHANKEALRLIDSYR